MPWFLIDPSSYRYPISAKELSLGRAADNDVVLHDEQASRHHAIIKLKDEQAWLFDRNSANGTYVNGERITQARLLRSGDQIRVGRTVFRCEYVSPPPVPAAAPRPAEKSATGASPWPAILAGAAVGILGLLIIYLAFVRPIMARTATANNDQQNPYALYQPALQSIVFVLTPIEGATSATAASGVVMSENGRILTAYSAVFDLNTGQPYNHKNQAIIGLNLNGLYDGRALQNWYLARVVRADAQRDLAVLQIFAQQDDSPLPNSFRLQPIAATGTLSAAEETSLAVISFVASGGTGQDVGRTLTIGEGQFRGYLPDATLNSPRGWMQSDIRLSLANLGGLALDGQGRLVGLYTGASSSEGTALLRPLEMANPLLVGAR